MTTKVSTKGQVVLPKSLRAARRWDPGTELVVEERPEGVLLRAKGRIRSKTWKDVLGILPYKGRPKSLKDMERAIEAEALAHR